VSEGDSFSCCAVCFFP